MTKNKSTYNVNDELADLNQKAMEEATQQVLEEQFFLGEFVSSEEDNKLIEKMQLKAQEAKEKEFAFWNTGICQKMAQDLIAKNKSISDEHWSYFPHEVKDYMDWNHYSNDDINMFITCMISQHLPMDKPSTIDGECSFENETIYRLGLEASVMWGQGVAIVIHPVGWKPNNS